MEIILEEEKFSADLLSWSMFLPVLVMCYLWLQNCTEAAFYFWRVGWDMWSCGVTVMPSDIYIYIYIYIIFSFAVQEMHLISYEKWYTLTLSLLMSCIYIYGAPSKARNLTSCIYIYMDEIFIGDFASWTVHFINICVNNQQIHQLFIQFINYVW
jgi:hypothetical protein